LRHFTRFPSDPRGGAAKNFHGFLYLTRKSELKETPFSVSVGILARSAGLKEQIDFSTSD
jgi:hypothetical protein